MLDSSVSFFSKKEKAGLLPVYWQVTGAFGFIPSVDLTPLLTKTALDSLSESESKRLSQIVKDVVEQKMLFEHFSALEANVRVYSSVKRSMLVTDVFPGLPYAGLPSSEAILYTLSKVLAGSARLRREEERADLRELIGSYGRSSLRLINVIEEGTAKLECNESRKLQNFSKALYLSLADREPVILGKLLVSQADVGRKPTVSKRGNFLW